jgi:hypothetical protein
MSGSSPRVEDGPQPEGCSRCLTVLERRACHFKRSGRVRNRRSRPQDRTWSSARQRKNQAPAVAITGTEPRVITGSGNDARASQQVRATRGSNYPPDRRVSAAQAASTREPVGTLRAQPSGAEDMGRAPDGWLRKETPLTRGVAGCSACVNSDSGSVTGVVASHFCAWLPACLAARPSDTFGRWCDAAYAAFVVGVELIIDSLRIVVQSKLCNFQAS